MKFWFYTLLMPLLVFLGLARRAEVPWLETKKLMALPLGKPRPEQRIRRVWLKHDKTSRCILHLRRPFARSIWRANYRGTREYRSTSKETDIPIRR